MKFIRNFLSVILAIIFTIILSAGIFTYSIRAFVSKENLTDTVNEIGIEKFIEYDMDENPEIVKNYLDIPEVKELLDKIMGQAVDYIFNNKEAPQITEADITKIVNSNYYESELGIKLTEEEKAEFAKELTKTYATTNETIKEELDTVKNELYENEVLEIVLSETIISTIVITLIIIALLIGLCRWSLYRPLSWIGISMIIAGGLNIILNILVSSTLKGEENDFLTADIINLLVTKWQNISVLISVLGAILLISYFIFKSKFNKNIETKTENNL